MEARLWKFSLRVIDLGEGKSVYVTRHKTCTEKQLSLDGNKNEYETYSTSHQEEIHTRKFAVNAGVETADLPAVNKWGNWKRGESATLPSSELVFVDRGEFENLSPEEVESACFGLEMSVPYMGENLPLTWKDGVFTAPFGEFKHHGTSVEYVLEYDGRLWSLAGNIQDGTFYPEYWSSFYMELIDSVKDELGEDHLIGR